MVTSAAAMIDSAANDSSTGPLRFHGGMAGALAPMLFFLAGVIALGLAGAPDERGFWPILLGAWSLGLLLCPDRRAYAETLIAGASRPIVILMILAWLLAGVLAELMSASGFVGSLAAGAGALGLDGGAFTAAAFVIAAAVSTSTGTSLGTILLCAPLLYPAGAGSGADPAMLAAAILAGATFGDNISPVSDTTIASATTQDAEMGRVVRSRLPMALPAAALALFVFLLFGGEAAATVSAPVSTAGSSLAALPMVGAPILTFALLLLRRHLVVGLLAGCAAACLLGLAFGLFEAPALFHIDPASFGAQGLLRSGMERGVGISIFTLLLTGLAAGVEASGILERLLRFAEGRSAGRGQAEGWIFAVVSGTVLLTTHSVVAILTTGDFARRVGERQGIDRYRRANLLDATVCTYPFLLPYFIPTLLIASTTAGSEAVGMPRLGALEIGLRNGYSWALLAILLLTIVRGRQLFGRRAG